MVSIIVPVHNVEKYVEKCINSLLAQTYKNLEILLIDDGSTDSSGEICADFCRSNHKVKVFHTENEGVSNARNLGIKEAKGKFLAFIDADDWVDADYIETLVNGIEKYEADIYVCSYYDETREKSVALSFLQERHCVFETEKRHELLNDMMLWRYHICNPASVTDIGVPWGKIYRKEYLKQHVILFPYGVKRMQDTIFNLYAFYHAGRIVCDDIPKYHYRRNVNSSVYRFTEDIDQTAVKILEEIKKFYELHFIEEYELRQSVYCVRGISLLILCVNLFLGHQNCRLKLHEKIKRLEELSKRLGCENTDNRNVAELSKKYRLIRQLIHRKQYGILYLVLLANARMKQSFRKLYQ